MLIHKRSLVQKLGDRWQSNGINAHRFSNRRICNVQIAFNAGISRFSFCFCFISVSQALNNGDFSTTAFWSALRITSSWKSFAIFVYSIINEIKRSTEKLTDYRSTGTMQNTVWIDGKFFFYEKTTIQVKIALRLCCFSAPTSDPGGSTNSRLIPLNFNSHRPSWMCSTLYSVYQNSSNVFFFKQ